MQILTQSQKNIKYKEMLEKLEILNKQKSQLEFSINRLKENICEYETNNFIYSNDKKIFSNKSNNIANTNNNLL